MTAHECITMPDESEITFDHAHAHARAHARARARGKSNASSTTKTSSNIRMYVVAVILGSVYSIIATMSASSLIFPPTLVSETNIDIAVSAIKNEEPGNDETSNNKSPEPAPLARQSKNSQNAKKGPPGIVHRDRDRVVPASEPAPLARQSKKSKKAKKGPPDIVHRECDRVVPTSETSNGGIDHGEDDRCGLGYCVNGISARYLGSKLELPLKGPPYYIVQHGMERSGSTFQNQLLQAIVDLKSVDMKSALGNRRRPGIWTALPEPKTSLNNTEKVKGMIERAEAYGFLQKTHRSDRTQISICDFHKRGKEVVVFVSVPGDDGSSGNSSGTAANPKDEDDHLRTILEPLKISYDTGYIAHVQEMNGAEFKNCSSCQIETYYKPLFDLSGKEVEILRDYTAKFSILRQCCGRQMSKYNRLRLHGCDVSEFQNNAEHNYPWCENHNLPKIEELFITLLRNNGLRPPPRLSGWSKPGDCVKGDDLIRAGADFSKHHTWNGECTLDAVDSLI